MTERRLQFGSSEIRYQLIFAKRKTLGIRVTPEMQVIVRAPLNASLTKIESVLHKRGAWILRHIDKFRTYPAKRPVKKYVGGETHRYLGRPYTLRVSVGARETVKIVGRELQVVCKRKSDVKQLVTEWYSQNARIRLPQIVEPWLERFAAQGITAESIRLRKMRRHWGLCSPRGDITLNTELIKAARGSIECVIVHELCHLIHQNHSKDFYALKASFMPGWEKWKGRLEGVMG